jgi:hypothetical protein
MSRLARHSRVFWVEEPHLGIGPPGERFELGEPWPNLRVGRLVSRSDEPTFWRRLDEVLDQTIARAYGAPERERRRQQEDALLRQSSWDRIAGDMRALIADRLARRLAARDAR